MDSTLFETLGRELAPEQVTARLREAITSGVLRPGERINQAELAQRFGVSRMPVREALRRLHAEGLVTLLPYRSAIVSGLSVRELREIYEMRMALEVLALRIGCEEGDGLPLDDMEDILRRMDEGPDSDAWLALNTAFHDLLYTTADRPLLLENIGMLRNKSDRFLRLFAAKRDRTAHAQQEHWEILRALKRFDVDAACRLLQAHLESTITSLSETLGSGEASASEMEAHAREKSVAAGRAAADREE
ncbi:MAG: GntR family transcriptional regulator [Trueperaceae bacterium]